MAEESADTPEGVKMDSDTPFSAFLDPFSATEIVSSKNFMNGLWKEKTNLNDFTNGICKFVIPIDATRYKILVITEVSAGRLIKRHIHNDEPQIRIITSGSFILNGEKFTCGEWVLVPRGVEYEIYTHEGYTTLAAYGMSCQCSAAGGH